jgi:hypothetical protein
VSSSIATSFAFALRSLVTNFTGNARSSRHVSTAPLRSSATSWIVTVRRSTLPSRTPRIHSNSESEPMIPRLSVTSGTFVSPGSLRGAFSRSLPLRYSTTAISIPIGEHSWKPASGPSVFPVPRSTRKLNRP